jgi:hypothetical protein
VTFQEAIDKVKELLGLDPSGIEDNIATYRHKGEWLFNINYSPATDMWTASTTINRHGRCTNVDYLDWPGLVKYVQGKLDFLNRPATVPDEVIVELVDSVVYEPGGKWDCGILQFTLNTNLGRIEWDEVIPGPRHGDDSAETTLKIDGQVIDCDELELDLPDFEAPGKPGRWADEFASSADAEIPETMRAWLEANKQVLARVKGVAGLD